MLNRPDAPDPGEVKLTLAPKTGLLPASSTVTASGFANEVLTVALCPEPPVTVIEAGDPAVFVSEKLTEVSPDAAAVKLYGPAVAFAVNGAEAMPDALVTTVIVAVELLNLPDAPDAGAVNVTFTPETTLLPASRTVTARALVNPAFMTAL